MRDEPFLVVLINVHVVIVGDFITVQYLRLNEQLPHIASPSVHIHPPVLVVATAEPYPLEPAFQPFQVERYPLNFFVEGNHHSLPGEKGVVITIPIIASDNDVLHVMFFPNRVQQFNHFVEHERNVPVTGDKNVIRINVDRVTLFTDHLSV